MEYDFKKCTLCPRNCGANRITGVGYCGVSEKMRIARAALHFWEEPCISGKEGSGTVFFSGCSLGCVFCQNREISSPVKGKGSGIPPVGKDISKERLQQICFELKAAGANNINLVTPMHFAPQIREALLPIKKELALPIVINTGGYDTEQQLRFMEGVADIYLPDFKFFSSETAKEFAGAPDYPQVCKKALLEMARQVGKPVFNDKGMLLRGMIVRHLILPGKRKESIAALEELAALLNADQVLLSVMSQYTPQPGAAGDLARKITTFEQESVTKKARELGFCGYFQERSSAAEEYIPPFDLSGV